MSGASNFEPPRAAAAGNRSWKSTEHDRDSSLTDANIPWLQFQPNVADKLGGFLSDIFNDGRTAQDTVERNMAFYLLTALFLELGEKNELEKSIYLKPIHENIKSPCGPHTPVRRNTGLVTVRFIDLTSRKPTEDKSSPLPLHSVFVAVSRGIEVMVRNLVLKRKTLEIKGVDLMIYDAEHILDDDSGARPKAGSTKATGTRTTPAKVLRAVTAPANPMPATVPQAKTSPVDRTSGTVLPQVPSMNNSDERRSSRSNSVEPDSAPADPTPAQVTRRRRLKRHRGDNMDDAERLEIVRLYRNTPDHTWKERAQFHNLSVHNGTPTNRHPHHVARVIRQVTKRGTKSISTVVTELELSEQKKINANSNRLMSTVMPKVPDWMKHT